MGLFTDLMAQMEDIDRQGFDPMKESYVERMKNMPNPVGGGSSSSKGKISVNKTSRKYQLSPGMQVIEDEIEKRMETPEHDPSQDMTIRRQTESGEYILNKDKMEKEFGGEDGNAMTGFDLIKQNETGVDPSSVEVRESNGDRQYVAPKSDPSLGSYYDETNVMYDAYQDELQSDIPQTRGNVQDLIKQNRANLKMWLDNLPQDVFKKAGYKNKKELIQGEKLYYLY